MNTNVVSLPNEKTQDREALVIVVVLLANESGTISGSTNEICSLFG